MKQGTQSWYSGATQRDRMGREVEKRFRMGVGHIYTYGQFTLMLLGRKLDMNKRGGLAEGDAS